MRAEASKTANTRCTAILSVHFGLKGDQSHGADDENATRRDDRRRVRRCVDCRGLPPLAVGAENAAGLPSEHADITCRNEDILIGYDRSSRAFARKVGLPSRLTGLGVEFVQVARTDVDIAVRGAAAAARL